jgi:hypothetical protein
LRRLTVLRLSYYQRPPRPAFQETRTRRRNPVSVAFAGVYAFREWWKPSRRFQRCGLRHPAAVFR